MKNILKKTMPVLTLFLLFCFSSTVVGHPALEIVIKQIADHHDPVVKEKASQLAEKKTLTEEILVETFSDLHTEQADQIVKMLLMLCLLQHKPACFGKLLAHTKVLPKSTTLILLKLMAYAHKHDFVFALLKHSEPLCKYDCALFIEDIVTANQVAFRQNKPAWDTTIIGAAWLYCEHNPTKKLTNPVEQAIEILKGAKDSAALNEISEKVTRCKNEQMIKQQEALAPGRTFPSTTKHTPTPLTGILKPSSRTTSPQPPHTN